MYCLLVAPKNNGSSRIVLSKGPFTFWTKMGTPIVRSPWEILMNEIKDYIAEKSKLLALNKSISIPEAERRASEFLSAMAVITDWRHSFSENKITEVTVQTAVYAQEMAKGIAKTVTENKLTAEASSEYVAAREALEHTENDIAYLKAYYDIFMASHVFYRNLAKGENL